VEGRRKNESEPSIRFLSRPWATRFVNKATFGDLAVNWSVALRKTDSGVEGRLTFLGHNPVWLVWQISPEFHDKTRGTSRSLYRKVMVTGPQNSAECHIIVEVSGGERTIQSSERVKLSILHRALRRCCQNGLSYSSFVDPLIPHHSPQPVAGNTLSRYKAYHFLA